MFHADLGKNVRRSTFLFVDFGQLRQNSPNLTSETDKMRTVLTLTLSTLLAASATADSVTNQLKGCSTIKADAERLKCYDALSNSLEQRAEENFGQEQRQVVEEAPDSIEATITQIDQAAYGKLLITLDNGQVWRQNDSGRVNWKSGDKVIVERALFGSFKMKSASGGRTLRVKRVQ